MKNVLVGTAQLAFFLIVSSITARGLTTSAVVTHDFVLEALSEAIQDEYHSQQTYQKVTGDFGSVLPFANIIMAEGRHIAAISRLYAARNLSTPDSRWNESNVPRFESVEAACTAAVGFEKENVAMYDRLLKRELPDDVEIVFRKLRSASSNNHLPAFQRCAGRT